MQRILAWPGWRNPWLGVVLLMLVLLGGGLVARLVHEARQPGAVAVIVTTPDGMPIAEAAVGTVPRSFGANSSTVGILTNMDGWAGVSLQPGIYDIEIHADGYSPQSQRVTVLPESRQTLKFFLKP